MKKITLPLITLMFTVIMMSCAGRKVQKADYNVIPLPADIQLSADSADAFFLDKDVRIAYADEALKTNATLLAEYLENLTGLKLNVEESSEQPAPHSIYLTAGLESDNAEAYRLTVNADMVTIDGASPAGNFYGIQTLRKAIPSKEKQNVEFPAVVINDQPRFGYRGTLLDVARHPMEIDSIKCFVDMLALHNINRLHLHLTDDQGWRVEIKKYPRLTEVGSTRPGTVIGNNSNDYDTIPVSGFYTQDELKGLVAYAADRHITIVPEIDLPGHMVAALTAYPELGCTGGPYEVWRRWGVSEDLLCAGNDSVYTFLDDVLTEIMDIFPSEYIHVGGDECPKTRWEVCEKCQAKIRELGLKDDVHSKKEAKLQSYVMGHASETLAKHGRKMIGWDEILEGGLPDGAVIMSWRGTEGAHAAAAAGHDAILTPTSYCYIDYCQSRDRSTEPLGIGGYVPVEKVYSLEPTDGLSEAEAAHIMGAQVNLWREYIKTLYHSQYMTLPRLAAICEVQWTDPAKKDYKSFLQRLPQLLNHYDALGYNYARHIFDITGTITTDNDHLMLELTTMDNAPVFYTLDGTMPDDGSLRYEGPIALDSSATIKAVALRPGKPASHVYSDSVLFSKATGKNVILLSKPAERFKIGGPQELVDGMLGSMTFAEGKWMGFEATDFAAEVNLGKEEEISSVAARVLIDSNSWVYDARWMTVEVSTDGRTFTKVASEEYPALTEQTAAIVTHSLTFAPVKAQYVRVRLGCEMKMGQFQGVGAGQPGFIFVDEIAIN